MSPGANRRLTNPMIKMNHDSIEKMRANASAAENLLKSLANANRLMVLCHLVSGELSVGELERLVGLSQSSLSQHLARLRHQKILSCRKEGTTVYYSLSDENAASILQQLHVIYCQ